MRGFLKTIGSTKRLRLAAEGHDAGDLALDPAFVVFDSEAAASLPVYLAGTAVVGADINFSSWTPTNALVSWPALGFCPTGYCEIGKGDIYRSCYASGGAGFDWFLASSGLWLSIGGGWSYPVQLKYTIFLTKAFDA